MPQGAGATTLVRLSERILSYVTSSPQRARKERQR